MHLRCTIGGQFCCKQIGTMKKILLLSIIMTLSIAAFSQIRSLNKKQNNDEHGLPLKTLLLMEREFVVLDVYKNQGYLGLIAGGGVSNIIKGLKLLGRCVVSIDSFFIIPREIFNLQGIWVMPIFIEPIRIHKKLPQYKPAEDIDPEEYELMEMGLDFISET